MSTLTSIIIPVYNQALPYLEAALKSAVLQTLRDVEVIVVDDGSEPPVEPQLARFFRDVGKALTLRCEVVRQGNGGVAAALNAGLRESHGEYIQWLSSDDVFMLEKSRLQYNRMVQSGAMVCYCGYEEGLPQAKATWPAAEYPSRDALFGVLQQHCFINACTVMWHQSVFAEVGFFDEKVRHCQDYEFLLRCSERWNFVAVNLPLVRRRTHGGQMLNTLKDPAEAASKERDMAYLRERYGATAQVWLPQ